MTTYSELKAQAAELLKQAERLRKEEIKGVVAEIKARMAEYGVTIDDLKAPAKGGIKGQPVKAKYRNPETGATWTGRGKPPNWLKEAEAHGKSREAFLIS
jgi:DNA-binding protein H-NS